MRPPSTKELFSILLARDFRPEDQLIMVGANLPIARAAAIMANATTHPDARIMLGLGWQALGDGSPPPPVHPFTFDPGTLKADSWMYQSTVFDDTHYPDVFFIGGMELDRRGNVNLFGIPDGQGGWAVRGPGGIGISSLTTHAGGYYILMPHHDRRTFVERVSFITALGDATERRRLGLPGGGIRAVISPLGVFDFDDDGDMQVRTLHPGVEPDDVRAATGFALAIPDDPPRTPAVTDAELAFLRERVDVEGTLE